METRKRGRPSIGKKARKLALHIDLCDWERFLAIAHKKDLNGSQIVRKLIKQYIEENE